jgi:oligoribonuclease (3'-5' exoribonuclease)
MCDTSLDVLLEIAKLVTDINYQLQNKDCKHIVRSQGKSSQGEWCRVYSVSHTAYGITIRRELNKNSEKRKI